jgi:heme/copper-type cytochrome/quinol oxidase subunit 3
MAITTDHGDSHGEEHGDAALLEHGEGHHETPEQRDQKERLLLWLFIAGDGLFLLFELFYWFYLRALNTNGLWRGAQCTKANPCTDGLGNPIITEIHKANPWYSVGIAALAVVAALLIVLVERSAKNREGRGVISGVALLAFVALLAAVALQCFQFGKLPFTSIDGSYASTYLFFMGSTLGHLILLSFIGFGLWMRASRGKYDDGRWHQVRLIRLFAVWIAISIIILTLVSSLFA